MKMKNYLSKSYMMRYLIVMIALFFVGVAMSVMRASCLGTEPFSCLIYSISEKYNISMGITNGVINGGLLVFTLFAMRKSIGFGTVANILVLGNAADFGGYVIRELAGRQIVFHEMEHFTIRLLMLLCGMIVMVFSCSFYMSAELGMAPYDTLGDIVEKFTGGRLPFKWARIMIDSACVIIAYILSRTQGTQWQLIGVGTVILVLGVGPLLSFFRRKIAEPFIEKIKRLP